MTYYLSQIFFVINFVFYIISLFSTNKVKLVIFNVLSNICFATHFLLLNGLTGAVGTLICTFYSVVLFFLEKFKKNKAILPFTILTMIALVVSTALTWAGPISLFPMFSNLVYLFGMIFKNVVFVKICMFSSVILMSTYLLVLKSYAGFVGEIFLLISSIISIVKDFRASKHKEQNKENKKIENPS